MKENNKGKVFIFLSILGVIMLIPLLKGKPSEELEGELISTEFERINGLTK